MMQAWGKVRALLNDKGERIEEAGPSTPVQVVGWGKELVPRAGDALAVCESEQLARKASNAAAFSPSFPLCVCRFLLLLFFLLLVVLLILILPIFFFVFVFFFFVPVGGWLPIVPVPVGRRRLPPQKKHETPTKLCLRVVWRWWWRPARDRPRSVLPRSPNRARTSA